VPEVLKLEQLTKHFSGLEVLKGISLSVQAG